MTGEKRAARSLLGFMEEGDARSFWRTMVAPDWKSEEEFIALWRIAKSSVGASSSSSLTAEVLEIDKRFSDQLDAVMKDPLFSEAKQQMKWSFKLVEIDKLVCFQKFIYTDHSEAMAKDYDFKDSSKLIEFCLTDKPLKRRLAVISTPQEFTLMAPSQDLSVLGLALGQGPTTKRSTYGFTIGWGVPFTQVVTFNSRYILRNGFHRVYALRAYGLKHVACLLLEGNSAADTGIGNPGFLMRP